MRLSQLLQWLRPGRLPRPHGQPDPAMEPTPAPGAGRATQGLDRLDIQAAILLHLEWCVQFNEHLSGGIGRHHGLSPLPDARHCDFGRWLTTAADRAPGRHPRYAELVQSHERFHTLAEEALRLAREDRMDLAGTLLNTAFERERTHILAILRDMQRG